MKKILGIGSFLILLATGFIWMISAREAPVDFNAEVRPIFNNKCISCHGGVKKNGDFSLLFRHEALKAAESGLFAIVPAKPDSSELMRRLTHPDPETRMPLDADPLTEEEIAVLRKWIKQGAKWEEHWAYIPPNSDLKVPEIENEWIENDIDRFVWEKLEDLTLSPSKKAPKEVIIRRASLDLVGIPPDMEALDKFLADSLENAYEKLIDDLLASPHFGEKWASMWLDLARYGDSQGYQKDRYRDIWRYRDWVIDAFNQDMPFDQFTLEQLAGDLLPEPDTQQLLATAFHRNTMANDEGGTDDEEFRVAAVIDRVNTTFEVWQGVSMGCVQCHSHPYDPFLHKEFYQAYAFFNNSADNDRYDDFPRIKLKSAAQEREIEKLNKWLAENEEDEAFEEKKEELQAIEAGLTPVMQELEGEERRITRLFERGNWLVHGDTVQPGVPGILNDFDNTRPDRLGLAQWLISPENPLTARVIVNRFWEQIFGIGLVETLEDFGSQGAKPSNQKLLDYLAMRFMHEHKWSVKALLKEIMMSATYRQSSKVSPELLEIDPANRYFARGPRIRLSAEQIRDQALAVSGLLSKKMFGPSVMPPQPEGVWQVIRNVLRWKPSEGENRYRRGLYTFWRRSSPYPSLLAFDTPTKEYCVSRRIRTNTPIQALVTLNDSTYLESAYALAEQMIEVKAPNMDEKLAYGYRRASMRKPGEGVLLSLKKFYNESFAYYDQHPEDLQKFLVKEENPQAEKAAMVHVANVILNLDEIINKE